jgi:hypothetical protein
MEHQIDKCKEGWVIFSKKDPNLLTDISFFIIINSIQPTLSRQSLAPYLI